MSDTILVMFLFWNSLRTTTDHSLMNTRLVYDEEGTLNPSSVYCLCNSEDVGDSSSKTLLASHSMLHGDVTADDIVDTHSYLQ
jgi:hypothetical protein